MLMLGLLVCCLTGWLAFSLLSNGLVRFATDEQSILLVSDLHLDTLYHDRSNASTWCHKLDASLPSNFFNGRYGCDSPEFLIDSLFRALPSLVHRPTAILLGGDYTGAHAISEWYMDVFARIRRYVASAFPDVPVLPAMGNNEFAPNYGLWSNDTANYAFVAKSWAGLLAKSEVETLTAGGYYYRDFGRLQIIVLNTVMYHVYRPPDDRDDPHGQFAWLQKVCEAGRSQRAEIFVYFHIPPGITTRSHLRSQGWHPKYAEQFRKIYDEFKFTMVCGHLHEDALVPMSSGYIIATPAISPRHMNNPGFRLFRFARGAPVDYVQFYADLIANPRELVWKRQYSFRELYGAKNLSHGELRWVVGRILNDSALMWKYRENMHLRNYDKRPFHHCMLSSLSRAEMERCMTESTECSRG
jgi:Icc-related predicted phosphoesterase